MMDKKEYQRNWLAQRRANFYQDKFCMNCGSKDSLELDHVDPTTKVNHRIWSWSQERRDDEIAKCQILCHACHVQKSLEERNIVPYQHGTRTMYKIHRCRCDQCRAWRSSEYQREKTRA